MLLLFFHGCYSALEILTNYVFCSKSTFKKGMSNEEKKKLKQELKFLKMEDISSIHGISATWLCYNIAYRVRKEKGLLFSYRSWLKKLFHHFYPLCYSVAVGYWGLYVASQVLHSECGCYSMANMHYIATPPNWILNLVKLSKTCTQLQQVV